ncbi:MAG: acyltransferase family protein [Oscillospiraceae bacterium]|nr:acyltransferase family protein [Oscillospiraceae bacterium]
MNEAKQMPAKENKRFVNLDLLRIVSIYTMIIVHTAAMKWYSEPVDSYNWMIMNIYDSLVRFCVPVFIMLSGWNMLDPKRTSSIGELYGKRILRLVTAYIFWAAAYVFYDKIDLIAAGQKPFESIYDFINAIIVGHFHLWFVFMLVGLYIAIPVLKPIAENPKTARYFLAVSFFAAIFMPAFRYVPIIGTFTAQINEKLRLDVFLGYSFYFVLGYYLKNLKISKLIKLIIYSGGAASVIATVYLTYLSSVLKNIKCELFYEYLLPTTMLAALSVFIFFRDTVGKIKFSQKATKIISYISGCSFGMYLIHDFINMNLVKMGLTVVSVNPVFMVPLFAFIVFIISFIAVSIIKLIPGLNKFIV